MNMNLKTWFVGVGLTLLGSINAGAVFALLESRFLAAMIAGGGFLIVGVYLVALVWADQKPWRWLSFYTSHIHLLVISIPMILVRVLNPEAEFEELTVLGMPGPVFHEYSTLFYQVLLACTVIDVARFYYLKKAAKL